MGSSARRTHSRVPEVNTTLEGVLHDWSSSFDDDERIAVIATSGRTPPPVRICGDGTLLAYDNGARWIAGPDDAKIAIAYADGYAVVRYQLLDIQSTSQSAPPMPPLAPAPVYAHVVPYRTLRHYAHAITGIVVVGAILPASVAIIIRWRDVEHGSLSYKYAHATLNILGVSAIAITAILLAAMPDHGGSELRRTHAAFGAIILVVGVTAVVISRVRFLRTYHPTVARILIVALATNAVIGGWIFGHATVLAAAVIASGLCFIVIVYGALHAQR